MQAITQLEFRLFPFRSPLLWKYSENRSFFSLGYLDVSVPLVLPSRQVGTIQRLICMGFPIRNPPDQSLFAASRGLSQLTASFIACWCQGIHHTPLVTWPQYFEIIREFYSRLTQKDICLYLYFKDRHRIKKK